MLYILGVVGKCKHARVAVGRWTCCSCMLRQVDLLFFIKGDVLKSSCFNIRHQSMNMFKKHAAYYCNTCMLLPSVPLYGQQLQLPTTPTRACFYFPVMSLFANACHSRLLLHSTADCI